MQTGWDIFHGGPALPVLTPAACEDLVARLMALSADWTGRQALDNQVHRFHTLGAATYLDSPSVYSERARHANPLLRKNFADLHEAVCHAITAQTGYPCTLTDNLGLPGFHIFRGDHRAPPGLMYGGTIHMDKPHERHDFPGPIDGTLSLTLPVSIPRSGAGMYFWKDIPEDLLTGPKTPHDMSPTQLQWFDTHKQFVGYTAGEMVLHDGLTVHQLANPGATDSKDLRVSLQGHGVLCDGAWELFF